MQNFIVYKLGNMFRVIFTIMHEICVWHKTAPQGDKYNKLTYFNEML